VCDDYWSKEDANVVCRMLCFSGAVQETEASHFGPVSTDFLINKVSCRGNETNILDCSFSKTHQCGANEGAGVVCQGKVYIVNALMLCSLCSSTACHSQPK
jgi:hypothetical protein